MGQVRRVLIVGSKGMAGHVIRQILLQEKKYEVIDIARDDSFFVPVHKMDVSDTTAVSRVLSDVDADIVINCAGILNQYAEANPDEAIFINSYLPHFLAKNCKKLIHISTDCVFNGQRGNYTEADFKDGVGFYAQSKALGEVTYDQHLTIRTSIIGPELKKNGIGLLHWFLNQTGTVKGYRNAYWSGVTTLQLAKNICEILAMPGLKGLVHLTNNQKINKYDLLCLVKSAFSLDFLDVEPYDDYQVDKSLVNTRNDFSVSVPDYKYMIEDLARYMRSYHTELYASY